MYHQSQASANIAQDEMVSELQLLKLLAIDYEDVLRKLNQLEAVCVQLTSENNELRDVVAL